MILTNLQHEYLYSQSKLYSLGSSILNQGLYHLVNLRCPRRKILLKEPSSGRPEFGSRVDCYRIYPFLHVTQALISVSSVSAYLIRKEE